MILLLQLRKLTLIKSYLIFSPYSDFPGCLNALLHILRSPLQDPIPVQTLSILSVSQSRTVLCTSFVFHVMSLARLVNR